MCTYVCIEDLRWAWLIDSKLAEVYGSDRHFEWQKMYTVMQQETAYLVAQAFGRKSTLVSTSYRQLTY